VVGYRLERPLLYCEEGNFIWMKLEKEKLIKIWHAIITEENQSVNNREQKSPQICPKRKPNSLGYIKFKNTYMSKKIAHYKQNENEKFKTEGTSLEISPERMTN